MNKDKVKAILEAAAELPPAEARRVVKAITEASAGEEPSMEQAMEDARENFIAAMSYAILKRLEEETPEEL